MSNITKIVTDLNNLNVAEIIELKKALEAEWGVTAAVAAAPAAAAAAAPAAEEKTAFDVVLKAAGDKKLDVIKLVREQTGLGLKEAKDLVEAADSKIKTGVSKTDAETLKTALEALGAKVELK